MFLEVLFNPLAAYCELASFGHGDEFRRIIDDFFGNSGFEQIAICPIIRYPFYDSWSCGASEIVDGLEFASASVLLFTRLGDGVE